MRAPVLLLFKAFPSHRGRPGMVGGSVPRAAPDGRGASGGEAPVLPPSSGIASAKEAWDYWQQHIAGRTLTLTVRTKAGRFAVRVTFDDTNTHMWTRKAEPGERPDAYDGPASRRGPRVFDPDRARLMDRLFAAIAEPWRVLREHHDQQRDLYLASPPLNAAGDSYVVVLSVKQPGVAEFSSARPRSREQMRRLEQRSRPVLPAGLQASDLLKSEAPRLFTPGLQPSFPLAAPSGRAPLPGLGASHPEEWRRSQAMEGMARFLDLLKSIPPGARWITVGSPHTRG